MKKILNGVKSGLLALFFSVIISGFCFASNDKMQVQTDQKEIKVTYGPESNGPENFWPDKSLKDVFLRYWEAKRSKNWEAARKIEAPYFQEMTDPVRYKMYMTTGKIWPSVELQLEQFNWEEEQLCKIKMGIYFQSKDGKREKVHLSDWWVKAGGKWYHVMRDDFFFAGV